MCSCMLSQLLSSYVQSHMSQLLGADLCSCPTVSETTHISSQLPPLLDSFYPFFHNDLGTLEGGDTVHLLHLGPSSLQSLVVCTLASCKFLC